MLWPHHQMWLVWLITSNPNPSVLKIEKWKINSKENKRKLSPLPVILTTDIQEIRENVIYKSLKSYRSIGKTEGYYRPFKWFIACPKSSLSFITVGDANQIVSMVKIYLWVNPSFARWVQQIGDEWKCIAILLGDVIKTAEVNTKVQWTIFLLNK